MKPLGGGWFLLERRGLRTLFNTHTLEIRIPGRNEPIPAELPAEKPPKPPPPSIRVLQVVVTERCNLACSYCAAAGMRQSGRMLTGSDVPSVLDLCRDLCQSDDPLFAVTGGEPLTAPKALRSLLRKAWGRKVLFSNCTMLTEGWIRLLQSTGTALVASLDGSRERHDAARRYPDGSGSWESVARGLDLAAQMDLPFGVSMVFRGGGAMEFLTETEELVRRFSPASLGVNLMHANPGGERGPDPGDYANICAGLFSLSRRTGLFVDQVSRRLEPLVRRSVRFRDCSAMGEKAVIFPDLRVSGCVNDPETPPGSWSNRLPLNEEACSRCPALGICGGGCAYDGIRLAGGGMDSRNCVWTLRLLEEMLLDIARTFPECSPSREELQREYGYMLSRGGSVLRSSLGHEQ